MELGNKLPFNKNGGITLSHSSIKQHEHDMKSRFVASCLEEPAFDIYNRGLTTGDKQDPSKITAFLLKLFKGEHSNREEALNMLIKRRRLCGELAETYAYKIAGLVKLAYAGFNAEIQNNIAKDYYIKGLRKEIQLALKSITAISTITLKDLVEETVCLEIGGFKSDKINAIGSIQMNIRKIDINDTIVDKADHPSANLPRQEVAAVNYVNHKAHETNNRSNRRGKPPFRRKHPPRQDFSKCRSCQSSVHPIQDCPVRYCQACGNRGHDAWNPTCPNHNTICKDIRNEIGDVDTDMPIILRAKVNGKKAYAMLDTGASCCVIHFETIEKFKLTSQMEKLDISVSRCRDASGNEMEIIGKIILSTSIMGTPGEFAHEFRVLNSKVSSNIILGRDFLKLYDEIAFDFQNNRIKVGKIWLRGIQIHKDQRVSLLDDLIVPPKSEKVILVCCSKNHSLLVGEFQPRMAFCKGLYASRAQVIPNIHGHFYITLLNVNENKICLKRKHKLGIFRKCDTSVEK